MPLIFFGKRKSEKIETRNHGLDKINKTRQVEMCDYPQNTKKGEQKKRYKAVYNQKSIRIAEAAKERASVAVPNNKKKK